MGSRLGEVITLQFGGYANWTGAHFWNFQVRRPFASHPSRRASPGKQSDGTLDRSLTFPSLPTPQDEAQGLAEGEDDSSRAYAAIDSGVLYRVGETARGVPTYVPRVVSFDLGGTMGGVRRAGHLYGDDDAAADADGNLPPITSWDGGHAVFRQEQAHKSAFLRNLEEDALVDALDGDEEEEKEDASHAENDDPDRRMDTDDSEDEDDSEDGARRSKWGGSTKRSRNGGDVDAVAALRAKMTAQLRVGVTDGRRGRGDRDGRGEDENRRAAALEDENRRAAALEASASTLAADARSWTDFCKACLHPRSSATLPGLWSGVDAFAGFGEGVDLFRSDERREEARDAVRYWAEECDHLRGFQVFAEDLGGFGGVAATVTEEIRDEYGGAPTVLFSLRPPANTRESAQYRARLALLNDAMASAVLAPNCDVYVPVACPDASAVRVAGLPGYDGDGRYVASALKAAAIDTATLTWRVRDDGRGDGCVGGTGMRGVAAHLSARTGAPFAAMTATMPCEPIDDDSREGSRGGYVVPGEPNRSDSLLATRVRGAFDAAARTEDVTRARAVLSRQVHYTPGCDDDDELEPLAEVYSARGWRVRMGGRDDASIEGGSSAAGGSSTSAATPHQTRRALDRALAREAYRAPRLRFAAAAPLPLPLPFPRVFRRGGRSGEPRENPRECGAMTRLVVARSYGRVLREMNAGWRRAVRGGAGKATVASWGYGGDDVDDVGETLASAAGALLDGSDAGDEFEFDDVDDE